MNFLIGWAKQVHPVRAIIALGLIGAVVYFKAYGIVIEAEFWALVGLAVGFYFGKS